MKKLVSLVVVCLMLGTSFALQAEVKIAVVNYNRVMTEAPRVKSATAAIDSEFKLKRDQLAAKANEIKALQDNFKRDFETMSEDQKRVKSEEFRAKAEEFSAKEKQLVQEFNKKRNEKLEEIQQLLNSQINSLAVEKGYDLILTQGIAYASSSVDITDSLIARLQ